MTVFVRNVFSNWESTQYCQARLLCVCVSAYQTTESVCVWPIVRLTMRLRTASNCFVSFEISFSRSPSLSLLVLSVNDLYMNQHISAVVSSFQSAFARLHFNKWCNRVDDLGYIVECEPMTRQFHTHKHRASVYSWWFQYCSTGNMTNRQPNEYEWRIMITQTRSKYDRHLVASP